MAIILSGTNGIDMGNTPVSNASQVEVQEEQVTPFSGFKNYIINGGFNVNQYSAFSNLSDGYKFDRWFITGAANIGFASIVDLQNGVAGAITRSNKGLNFTKTGTGSAWISQRIEAPTKLSGRTVTLSFKAYSAVAINTTVYFDSYNPTNGFTVNFGSLAQTFTLLVGWNTYSVTFKLPVIGVNYTNIASYLQLNLHLPDSTTTDAWISDVQLEEGSVATPFEQRPYGLELSLCQRYYQKFITDGSNGELCYHERTMITAPGITFVTKTIPFKVDMRTTPSVTIPRVFNQTIDYDTGWQVYHSGLSAGTGGIAIYKTTNTIANHIIAFNATASAEL